MTAIKMPDKPCLSIILPAIVFAANVVAAFWQPGSIQEMRTLFSPQGIPKKQQYNTWEAITSIVPLATSSIILRLWVFRSVKLWVEKMLKIEKSKRDPHIVKMKTRCVKNSKPGIFHFMCQDFLMILTQWNKQYMCLLCP